MIRSLGELTRLDVPPLSDEDTRDLAKLLLPPDRFDQLMAEGDGEVARTFAGLGRYRINAYSQRESIGLVFRLVTSSVPSIEELHLPPAVKGFAEPVPVVSLHASNLDRHATLRAFVDSVMRPVRDLRNR